ncbi:aquaporin family protein [Acaricomes phytoseiuli]|uniref:MIP/aquaporin family protein n=1 Tax=Acaricomes phytoseiuli TaxID=291968 RepID=UPI002221833A|nr:MIP/aquaporin family protein [Acaricomes phytoseiuli]MCW1249158.1 aquaporin family protein [Acaricomes phytoseiuli]
MNLLEIFLSEFFGTAILILLGTGVVANVALKGTKGFSGGTLMVNFGWGLGVFAGVYVAFKSGAHLNPAVTVGVAINKLLSGEQEFIPGVAINGGTVALYISAQLLGAIVGAILCWLAYKQHFDAEPAAGAKLGVFATGPAIRNYGWNLVSEVIATFVLVFVVLLFAGTPTALGPLAVALLVVGIGASLGGPTGYAINPARDLGPRIAHAILPIKGKGSSDWSYSWVPIVGPMLGGTIAALLAPAVSLWVQ